MEGLKLLNKGGLLRAIVCAILLNMHCGLKFRARNKPTKPNVHTQKSACGFFTIVKVMILDCGSITTFPFRLFWDLQSANTMIF